jgi:signal transduction histidine kinase
MDDPRKIALVPALLDDALILMSHELRMPLTSMLGRSELLLDDVYGSLETAQRRAVEGIARSGRYMLHMIDGVLDLVRTAAGAPLHIAPINVLPLCTDCVELIQDAAQARGIQLTLTLSDELPPVGANATHLVQVLINLLTNALKHTPAGGVIGLETAFDPDTATVQLAVWDTGVGIAPDVQERIFQPYVQVDRYASGGLGIGLALARCLVHLHKGRIELESSIGLGSRFTVFLPVWRGER